MHIAFQRTAIVLAAALSTSLPAHALKFGIQPSTAPGAPAIVNPFTGQATDVWKLVGYLGCSGFQISREWALHAGHCAVNQNATATFTNHLGSSPVLGTDCYRQGTRDYQLCRLQNPGNLTPASSYPAMLALPQAWYADKANAAKYGSLMGYGRSGAGDGLAFGGVDGLPFGFDPVNTAAIPLPYTVGGDSGGAAYWFAPGTGTPYMVGVLVVAGTVVTSPLFLDESDLAWIKSTIEARGDVAPAIAVASQIYTPPTANPAPELPSPPTIARVGSSNSTTLSWTAPTATPALTHYQVTVGHGGLLERNLSVSAGAATQLTLNNLSADIHMLCVRPVNAAGAARAARIAGGGNAYTTPDCTSFDNRDTQSIVTGLATSGNTPISGQVRVNFQWNATTPLPADLALSGHRVNQSVTYVTGPVRNSSLDVGGTAHSVSVPAGSKVCISVAPVTTTGKLGAFSAQVCATAN